ncbi:hypothetical protein GpartN1_g6911.t1 [Galdieria partita]|uniref:Uncharacterized protein n=1 Tax=Galdieria partita TaxID=83374 RepID=A0A9C7Q124_9RHOD|nr:hypothetical protein GpartN1_g6115.t1 [Galdieria partita]GJQ15120.1 hypothetical protein GpartN1_g6911.t1 [Galdieria partita]
MKGASRYDYVKVRVWLGGQHYYVLSRFSVSQILMLCRVPQKEAQKIALRLKKQLIDQGILDIEQENLNQSLFQVAQSFGFSETAFQLYTKVLKFYQLKLPLFIVLYGVHQVAMTEIAGRVAERLNIYNVLDTDTVYRVWRLLSFQEEPSVSTSCWVYRVGEWKKELLLNSAQQNSWFSALEGNLCKSFREGKALIVYGLFLQPIPVVSLLEKYSVKGRKPYFLQYLIDSELFELQLEEELNTAEHSDWIKQLYEELYDIQREYKKQAETKAIPCLHMDSSKDSISQVIENIHEDYLRLVVSLSEEVTKKEELKVDLQ